MCQFLARCQSPTGGFAGGPGQHAHLAPTYAAVNALCILGTEEAYSVINRLVVLHQRSNKTHSQPWCNACSPSPTREKLLDFLFSVKQPDGSFVMHVGGEVDVRWASLPWFRGYVGMTMVYSPGPDSNTRPLQTAELHRDGLSGPCCVQHIKYRTDLWFEFSDVKKKEKDDDWIIRLILFLSFKTWCEC